MLFEVLTNYLFDFARERWLHAEGNCLNFRHGIPIHLLRVVLPSARLLDHLRNVLEDFLRNETCATDPKT
jgi:hypothetical protein